MFGIGMGELVVIFVIALLLFGPKALPELARGLGQAVKLFKQEARDLQRTIETEASQPANNLASADQVQTIDRNENDFNPNSSRRDWRPTRNEGDGKV